MPCQSQRRRLLQAPLALLAVPALAQNTYPDRPVRIMTPLPPGSAVDAAARFVARQFADNFRQPFVVENRPGANGFIAARAAAEAPPDGYTLFLGSNSTMVTNAALFSKLPYDPVQGFSPIARIARFAMVIVVPGNSPYRTLAGLVDAIRKSPGGVNYASGTTAYQVYMELLHARFGVKGNPIAYKGTAPAMIGVAAGDVDYGLAEVSTVLPLVRAGRIRALAVMDVRRHRELPQVPTVAESGAPGFELAAWAAIFAPARVPEHIVTRLSESLRTTMQSPASEKFLSDLGGAVFPAGPRELREFQLAEIARTREIVKAAGIPVE